MSRSLLCLFVLTGCLHPPDETESDTGGWKNSYADGYADGYADAIGEMEERISEIEDRIAENEARISSIEDKHIEEDTTFQVGPSGDFADLNVALAWLDSRSIASGATVTLQVEEGSYTYDEPVLVRHPDGRNIVIVGDPDAPDDVVLVFSGTGVIVGPDSALGYLGGFTIQGAGTKSQDGIYVVDNSAILSLGPMRIEDFYTGLHAGFSSLIRQDPSLSSVSDALIVNECTIGIYSQAMSGISVYSANVQVGRTDGTWGLLIDSGYLDAARATVDGFHVGAEVSHLGVLSVESGSISGADVGAKSVYSYLNVSAAAFTGNGIDILSDQNGFVDARGVSSSAIAKYTNMETDDLILGLSATP